MNKAVLIVGDRRDAHVTAVTNGVRYLKGPSPVLVDAPALADATYRLDGLTLRLGDRTIVLDSDTRGWLRRYAPTLWGAGTITGSLESARRRAFLALVGAISRVGCTRWLTPLEVMLRAEDRLLQLHIASSLGIDVPRTVVTSDGQLAREVLGDQFVVKPLAGGYYNTVDGPRAVFTSVLDRHQLAEVDFSDAPFAAQEILQAQRHFRIVTVGENAWVAELSGVDRPLDWRAQEEAHSSWTPARAPAIANSALALARELNVGYTSQDWIDDGDRVAFIDLNPGGQWLFLPDEISQAVTVAIAQHLVGADS